MFNQQMNVPPQVQQWVLQNPQAVQQFIAQAYSGAQNQNTAAMMNQPYANTATQPMNWNRPVSLSSSNNFNQGGTPPCIYGKVISNLQDIRPNDVSLDGSVSLFPMGDYSCIYAKAWGNDGTIQTFKFVPEKIEAGGNEGPSQFDQVMGKLTAIESALTQQLPVTKTKTTANTNQKKEVD